MKVLIDGLNIFYSEKVRLVKTLMKREYPEEYNTLFKWALQMLYFNGNNWIEICRIDNYIHKNQTGSHVHYYKQDAVKRVDISFKDAELVIKEISARILKEKFKERIEFD